MLCAVVRFRPLGRPADAFLFMVRHLKALEPASFLI